MAEQEDTEQGDEELEPKYPKIACKSCDPTLGARLYLIGRLEHPEDFWRARSYWRHLQEMHTLPCAWVAAHIPAYLRLQLPPDEDERTLLHIGECKECHTALLGLIAYIRQNQQLFTELVAPVE
ncbi:MAG: zf-HC2 domain-containing protein [Candidatus Sungbacteria bacterium]|uniref:Zf-HC2 domain-containing protein n=1 Tax=Candidatus Sungiibacteriota bacterium TaxID=2750080 RepID=A0A932YY04_9BACT|nr:zf-HC2 domain-containing protein [Candidatus Sungbacteria bacterium]